MKTLYETLGGTYREENGRLIPEIKLPEQTNYQIGKYGQFYLAYSKNHRRGRYTTLLTEGTQEQLAEYLGITSRAVSL